MPVTDKEQRWLDELVAKLRSALGDRLESVVLYGSGASNSEFQPEFSDLNVLCVVRDNGGASLAAMGPAARWWTAKRQPSPLVLTNEELTQAADVFAIELTDMKAKHRVLFGADPLQTLGVPMQLHRLQLERELRVNLIRLRQRYLAVEGAGAVARLMGESVSTFVTLFRHVLVAFGERVPPTRREVVAHLESLLHLDMSAVHAVLEMRASGSSALPEKPEKVFDDYLSALAAVTKDVDQRLA